MCVVTYGLKTKLDFEVYFQCFENCFSINLIGAGIDIFSINIFYTDRINFTVLLLLYSFLGCYYYIHSLSSDLYSILN